MGKKLKEIIIQILEHFTGKIDELDPSISKELEGETIEYLIEFCRVYKRGKKFDMRGVKKGEINRRLEVVKELLEINKEKAYEYIFYNLETLYVKMSKNSYYRFRNGLKDIENYEQNKYNIWLNQQNFSTKAREEFIESFDREQIEILTG